MDGIISEELFDIVSWGLKRLDSVGDIKMNEFTLETWCLSLAGELSVDEIRAGFIYLFKTGTSKYNPKYKASDIIAYIKSLKASSWSEAWEEACYKSFRSQDDSTHLTGGINWTDPLVGDVVSRIGGVSVLKTMLTKDVPIIRAQFRDMYNQALDRKDQRKIADDAGILEAPKTNNVIHIEDHVKKIGEAWGM
jgi:hypothetical protein